MCVATSAGSEALTISLPQCIDTSFASVVMDGTGRIAFGTVEAGSPNPSSAFPLRSPIRSFGTVSSFPIVANPSRQFEFGSSFDTHAP